MAVDERGEHWLRRHDAGAWLRAARTELAAAEAQLESRRTAVTHARRAAGMAVNAVLMVRELEGDELRWGRSYIDHLRALADADEARAHPLSAASRSAAAQLLAIPVVPGSSSLIQLGRSPHSAAQQALTAARELVDDCAEVVARLSSRTA